MKVKTISRIEEDWTRETKSDILYKGFCMYEQQRIFVNMQLDYDRQIFDKPFRDF